MEVRGDGTMDYFSVTNLENKAVLGKVIPLQAQKVGRGIALLFHNRGTRRG
jgi:hypothetical protein